MLVAVHAVDRMRDVHLHVAAALGRRHELQLLRRHDDPFALLAVAHHVRLDVRRAVVVLVALQVGERGLVRLEVVAREDAGPDHERALAEALARLDQVLVREVVVGRRLHVQARGDAIGEIGDEAPVLRLEHVVGPELPVRVRVHEAWHDVLAAHVDLARAGGNPDPTRRTHGRDAVIGHEDVGVPDDLLSLHRDDRRVAQRHRALRHGARKLEDDLDRLDGLVEVERFLFLVLLGLRVLLLVLARAVVLLLRREINRIERPPEVGRADRPREHLAVGRPPEVVGADVGEPFGRQRRAPHVYRRRAARVGRHGHHPELVVHGREGPLAIGPHDYRVGCGRARHARAPGPRHLQVRPPIRPVVAQRDQPVV